MAQTTEERLQQAGSKSISLSFEESLLQVIKKDDIKAFNALMDKNQCGAYRLGRFPVLSLLYLYKSKKILSAYEPLFLGIANFKVLSEPLEISHKFSVRAGKCLRLYLNEVVSPVEMLLILDDTKRLKQVYPKTNPSPTVKARLKSIYYIKYSLNVKFEGNDILIDRRPLSYGEKKRVIIASICLIVVLAVVIGASVTTSVFAPKRLDKYINLSSDEVYTLDHDVYVPKNFSIEEFNCTVIGQGHRLVFGKGATLGVLNGKISDLRVESLGDALFTAISPNASIENVVVDVEANISATEGVAFVALTNYGTIDSVTVNVKGKINALATSAEVTEELIFGGIVLQNYNRSQNLIGAIKNCSVNYSQFTLVGEASANAVFGGVAGVNNGYLQDCKVTGEIIADTFDIAGVCYVNNGLLSNDVNEANLSQTSANTGWNPIVSGIVVNNGYTVENCHNAGNISATSSCDPSAVEDGKEPAVSMAGIAYVNSGGITKCKNSGNITAIGIGKAYVGGISTHSYSMISDCYSIGEITVSSNTVYAGGILGVSEIASEPTIFGYYNIYFGTVESCISGCKLNITATGDTQSYVGGIAGFVSEEGFNGKDSKVYYGGCVTNSYFTGACISDITYFGNIVGVSGANIYQSNSYTSGGKEYYNFDGNYYAENTYNAFGATVNDDKEFAKVEDKGATSNTLENIQNLKGYKDILNSFSSK